MGFEVKIDDNCWYSSTGILETQSSKLTHA